MNGFVSVSQAVTVEILQRTKRGLHGLHGLRGLRGLRGQQSAFYHDRICWSRVWIQTELDDTKSCYHLIKTMKKFEKEARHLLYVIIKNNNNNNNNSWRVNCPLNWPFTLFNYEHDAYTALLELNSGWCSIILLGGGNKQTEEKAWN